MSLLTIDHSPDFSVVCFGEILLRLSPRLNGRFIEDANMAAYVGGAELNVATALANWKLPVKYVSAVPDNYLAREILTCLEQKNIDVSSFIFFGNRIGSYYLPQGADLKHNAVIYDRAHSSFAELQPGYVNWDEVLSGASWFHFSAISPALNESAAAICLEGVKVAKAKGITVSVDLNHRAKLWQYGKQPVDVMPELVQYCDVVMGNVWAAQTLLGIAPEEDFHEGDGSKLSYLQHADFSARQLMEKLPACHTVANTFRFDEGEGILYYAALNTREGQFSSGIYRTQSIIDKVGSGDCFMAGLIYGLALKNKPQSVIDFAAAAAFGKLQQMGDATTSTIADIQKIISNNEQER